jgi:glutathione S-transferase
VLRLITIPFSHYCEKARWALDRAHLAYREEGHLPLISWVAARRAGGSRFVPVLVTPGGVVGDSTDILKWCDAHGDAPPLFPDLPEVDALEDELDRRLGPAARLIAYHAALPTPAIARALFDSVPGWEGRVVGATYPLVRGAMMRLLRITPASVARAHTIVETTFAAIAARIADGRRYLTGDRFTAADLTFASLSAAVLAPPKYGGPLPPPTTWPADFARYLDSMRATPAGRFALRLYDDERAPAAR